VRKINIHCVCTQTSKQNNYQVSVVDSCHFGSLRLLLLAELTHFLSSPSFHAFLLFPFYVTQDGSTLLHIAIEHSRVVLLDFLLAHNADPNLQNDVCFPPLPCLFHTIPFLTTTSHHVTHTMHLFWENRTERHHCTWLADLESICSLGLYWRTAHQCMCKILYAEHSSSPSSSPSPSPSPSPFCCSCH
jgi:hypothetical protein